MLSRVNTTWMVRIPRDQAWKATPRRRKKRRGLQEAVRHRRVTSQQQGGPLSASALRPGEITRHPRFRRTSASPASVCEATTAHNIPTMVRQEVLLLDIAPDANLIKQYIDHHAPGNVPPAIVDSIRYPGSGVLNMRIFHFADRLVMIMDVEDDFSFEKKAASDGGNPDVDRWETLMENFQREIKDPEGKQTGKWKRAELCFDLSQH
ncbi:hypothetical protein PHSY_004070 [Pseudozyma hubeiensis SY62]|uniref:L-rhamnose mutarotase n=1 Tax=Pseudozyma hubeiensis (strain SY62) TaxID=1305764 RepID=R9PEG6_PSEHS|nr:hypothetical protein PHSY_004070 [Pseudozyma hubeiensis SY62]GAC96490.1 hypothetical protein PHSY_004070 [Pseudozyma hubeiensis SY62]